LEKKKFVCFFNLFVLLVATTMSSPTARKTTRNVDELSQKILQGWTLLAESCPSDGCNVPLVRSGKGDTYCCSCQVHFDAELNPLPPTAAQQAVPKASSSSSASSSQPKQEPSASVNEPMQETSPPAKPKDRSQLIADKLLAGWAMLNDVCPRPGCEGVPLVKSRDGRMWCVSCDTWVVHEDEFDPRVHVSVNANTP
jgi:uncharacterized Zn finger protein (UPF0148 family)